MINEIYIEIAKESCCPEVLLYISKGIKFPENGFHLEIVTQLNKFAFWWHAINMTEAINGQNRFERLMKSRGF